MITTGFEDNVPVLACWAGITTGLLFSKETARALVTISAPVEDTELLVVVLVVAVGLGWTLAVVLELLRFQ